MAKLVVEKYSDGQFEKRVNVPLALVRIAARILPDAALAQLKIKGIDLRTLSAASVANQPYQAVLDIREKRRNKTVVISLQD
ncbi:hypothetical protein [Pseudochrobactrum asaccharolyticum]|uniref:hypothetical protein n=1 Tax=Pseudochrobactrum asaccharolyticum TaxID=354351 RepID=UPI0040414248